MTDTIRPALTPEEWEAWGITECRCEICIGQMSPHAQAALALHGQPFGFTREDVEHLNQTGRLLARVRPRDAGAAERAMFDLAARIEALLPPEQK